MDIEVCLIDDEKDFLSVLEVFFKNKGLNVVAFSRASDFLKARDLSKHAIYLIDWNMPEMSGIELIKMIRKVDSISPIFMVSGYSKTDNMLDGHKAGADDYVVKPFDYNLLYRKILNAKEKLGKVLKSREISTNDSGLKLLKKANSFIKDGEIFNLTAREFTIFSKLISNKNAIFSREDLLKAFEKDDALIGRNIDVHIHSLRRKINPCGIQIQTIRGVGYKLTEGKTLI